MTAIDVAIGQCRLTAEIEDQPPLGWRFWSLAGFAGDPIDTNPYAGSRCLALTMVDVEGRDRWLCAMERGVETGDLRQVGLDRSDRPDRHQIVRLMEGRKWR